MVHNFRIVRLEAIQDRVDVVLLVSDHGELSFLGGLNLGCMHVFEFHVVSFGLFVRLHLIIYCFYLQIETMSRETSKNCDEEEKEAQVEEPTAGSTWSVHSGLQVRDEHVDLATSSHALLVLWSSGHFLCFGFLDKIAKLMLLF